MENTNSFENQPQYDVKRVIQIVIQLAVLLFIFGWCLQILLPFIAPVIWGLIIAITIYPLFLKLKAKLGNRGRLASILITVTFLALLIVPVIMLSESLVDGVQGFKVMLEEGHSPIPPPGERAKALPGFAQPLVSVWQEASENLQNAVVKHNDQFKAAGKLILGLIAQTGIGVLSFMLSIILAGIFLAYSQEGGATVRTISFKLAGKKGEELAAVSEATIRSVVKGILGVALIQTLFSGLGFFVAGIPAAGLWTVFCLILAIVQIGVGPVMIVAIIYMFNTSDVTSAIIFMVWGVLVMISDNILKPLLLGRSAPVPMLVVFLGAIGGFITIGFLGLFLGAVILSVGYKLFEAWLADGSVVAPEIESQVAP
jgi:predicted PurR-regulated permease PerM